MWNGCYGTDRLQLPFGVHSPGAVVDAWMRAWDRPDEVVATRTDGRVIPYDPSRRNGWDRVGAAGTVELFGEACRAVQNDRQGVRFTRPGARCR